MGRIGARLAVLVGLLAAVAQIVILAAGALWPDRSSALDEGDPINAARHSLIEAQIWITFAAIPATLLVCTLLIVGGIGALRSSRPEAWRMLAGGWAAAAAITLLNMRIVIPADGGFYSGFADYYVITPQLPTLILSIAMPLVSIAGLIIAVRHKA